MGEHKTISATKASASRSKMSSHSPSPSGLTTLLQSAPTAGDARIVRCPEETLARLRRLNEAEVVTLFTPHVPHPPSTTLAKDMDPFEPLGRALPRRVRHVPYRLDRGMTEMHTDFLPTCGAVVIVVCVTDNVLSGNAQAFQQQVDFAKGVWRKSWESQSIAGVPIVVLLVSNDAAARVYAEAMQDFPALIAINDYTTAALANVVRVLFE